MNNDYWIYACSTAAVMTTGSFWPYGEEKEEENMEYIYEVIVVTEDRKLVLRDEVIADTPENAKILAGVGEAIRKHGLDPRYVTINCEVRGKVKVKPRPQEVIVVDDPGMPNIHLEEIE